MQSNLKIAARRCASVAALQEIKDVTPADAAKIREIWSTEPNRAIARQEVDKILRTHGVEYLGRNKRTGKHVYYANAGDTYATTAIFSGPTLTVGDWGALVEANSIALPSESF